MKKKTAYCFSSVFALLSVIFTILVKTVDIGKADEVPSTKIGFSAINNAFHNLTGVNWFWYDVTKYMGIIAIAFGLLILAYGGIILLIRKSLKKVDRFIYALGGVYVILGVVYMFFEKVIINYRPIIMPGATEPEASFPSSHTLLIVTITITAAITFYRLFEGKKPLRIAVVTVASAYTCVAVFGRLYCGVHWLTDIIGSLLISAAIIFLYTAVSKDADKDLSK